MSDLDPIMHAPARLRIAVALHHLAHGDSIAFPRLRKELGMTAGNLSTHLRRLEDAGYISVDKVHERRTPVTYLSLTQEGRSALAAYRRALSAILGGDA